MKKSTIIIVLLIVLVLALGGYIAYDKIYLKEDTETTNTSNKSENKEEEEEKEDEEISLDVNDRLVQELYSLVVDKSSNPHYYFDENKTEELASSMDEEKKMQLIYHNFSNSDYTYTNCNNVNPETIENYSCSLAQTNLQGKNSIPSANVERIYKKVFGTDAKINTAVIIKINNDLERYIYNSNLDTYVSFMRIGGGESYSSTTTTITKAIKKADEIKIYEHAITKRVDGTTEEHDYYYTFKLEDDGMYSFYSRVKEK